MDAEAASRRIGQAIEVSVGCKEGSQKPNALPSEHSACPETTPGTSRPRSIDHRFKIPPPPGRELRDRGSKNGYQSPCSIGPTFPRSHEPVVSIRLIREQPTVPMRLRDPRRLPGVAGCSPISGPPRGRRWRLSSDPPGIP